MFNIDIPTLRLVGLILVICSIITFGALSGAKVARRTSLFWTLGVISFGLAYVATLFKVSFPYLFLNVLIDLTVICSALLFLRSIRETFKKPSIRAIEVITLVIIATFSTFFTYVENFPILRGGGISLVSSCIALLTALTLFAEIRKNLNSAKFACGFIFLLYALFQYSQLAYLGFADTIVQDYLLISFLSSSLFICALSLTFIFIDYHNLENLLDRAPLDSKIYFRNSKELWDLALEYSNSGAWECNFEKQKVNFSTQWKKMAGYEEDKELETPYTFIHPDDKAKVIKAFQQLIQGEHDSFESEHRVLCQNGSWLWVLSRGKLIQIDNKNSALRIIGTDTDITYQKNNEAQLKEAIEKIKSSQEAADIANRAKTTFLTNMSHEIRTPMNAILGFSQLLIEDPEVTPIQMDSLSIISKSGEHLLSLIDDVLNLSRIETGNFSIQNEEMGLLVLLNDVSSFFSNRPIKEHVKFELDFSPCLPDIIISDPKVLRQILTNLLSNAFKFTNAGKITFQVSVSNEGSSQGTLSAKVIDTGVGIAEEDSKLVFNAFEQTQIGMMSTEGSGLGLAISKNLANLIGGELSFSSELGRGTCFTLTLPITIFNETHPILARNNHDAIVQTNETGTRLLIVDDSESNRLLLKQQLEGMEFDILEASSADMGLQLIQEWNPRLVLMDLKMPGMSGDEAIFEIRKKLPNKSHLPIIVITANALEGEKERLIELGANDFICKPFTNLEVIEKVSNLLKMEYSCEKAQASESTHLAPTTKQFLKPKKNDTKRILVVDDNLDNQHLLQNQLQSLGYSADIASNGKEAIQKWQNHHYELIFSDCAMPIMNGFEMSDQIRQEEKYDSKGQAKTIIIAITGSPDEYKQQCLESKMDAVLAKPLLINELKLTLEKALNNLKR